MASSNQNSLFDPIRKKWVKATPEERVRQGYLSWMIKEGGFPPSLIAVEKELGSLPSPQKKEKLDRRADIVVYLNAARDPLLIVECKAVKLTKKSFQQVMAYHSHTSSLFVSVVSGNEAYTGWYLEGKLHIEKGFFPYRELIGTLSI